MFAVADVLTYYRTRHNPGRRTRARTGSVAGAVLVIELVWAFDGLCITDGVVNSLLLN